MIDSWRIIVSPHPTHLIDKLVLAAIYEQWRKGHVVKATLQLLRRGWRRLMYKRETFVYTPPEQNAFGFYAKMLDAWADSLVEENPAYFAMDWYKTNSRLPYCFVLPKSCRLRRKADVSETAIILKAIGEIIEFDTVLDMDYDQTNFTAVAIDDLTIATALRYAGWQMVSR